MFKYHEPQQFIIRHVAGNNHRIVTLIDLVILSIFYEVLKETTSRVAHLGMPVFFILAGYIVLIRFGSTSSVATVLFVLLLVINPFAVLIAAFGLPKIVYPATDLNRILLCQVIISATAVIALFFFRLDSLIALRIFNSIFLSTVIVYTVVVAFFIILAIGIFKIILAWNILPANINTKNE